MMHLRTISQSSFIAALISLMSIASTQGQTVQGDILRAEGCYLQGLGWYNLNTARANSINTDATIRWKQDLRRIAVERLDQQVRKDSDKKLRIEDVKRKQLSRQRELRVNPTAADIQSGETLNAILFDLTDPKITSEQWRSKVVPLTEGISIKKLIFQFTPINGASASSSALSRGVIALSRLDMNGKWPTVMQFEALHDGRYAYEKAYAAVRTSVLEGRFDLKTIQDLDASLESLKNGVKSSVPIDRGFRVEALKFVDDLANATRFFDAATVDYAQEMLIDTQEHDATTVEELVSFTLKYRLRFANAERSPTSRVLYGQLYENFLKQSKAFGIEPPSNDTVDAATIAPPADAVNFNGHYYKAFSENISWHLARTKCVEIGGHLVVISSAAENDFATRLAAKGNLETVWIGATDEDKESGWLWVTGKPVVYSNWCPGQPNNFKGNENYLELMVSGNLENWKNLPGQWNDLPRGPRKGVRTGYICQWD